MIIILSLLILLVIVPLITGIAILSYILVKKKNYNEQASLAEEVVKVAPTLPLALSANEIRELNYKNELDLFLKKEFKHLLEWIPTVGKEMYYQDAHAIKVIFTDGGFLNVKVNCLHKKFDFSVDEKRSKVEVVAEKVATTEEIVKKWFDNHADLLMSLKKRALSKSEKVYLITEDQLPKENDDVKDLIADMLVDKGNLFAQIIEDGILVQFEE